MSAETLVSVELDTSSISQPPLGVDVRAEHTLEILSDPGEGAQKCGQIFGAVSATLWVTRTQASPARKARR